MSFPSRNSSESELTLLKTLLEKVAQDVQTLSYRQLQYETQLKEGDAQFALIQDEWKMVKERDESNKSKRIDGELFRHEFTHPILVCVREDQCARIMAELYKGICGSHIGGRSLASKAIRAGYYWPTVREDCTRYAQQCKQCRQHADWHKAPPAELRSIYSPWSFHTWGIDILGPFPLAVFSPVDFNGFFGLPILA